MLNLPDPELTEAHLAELVRRFYDQARADPLLGPLFAAHVDDWPQHLEIVHNFWSHALLGTDRYRGGPWQVHARLPLTPEHFERWLALFHATARAVLPEHAAGAAIRRAELVADSFKSALFLRPREAGPAAR